jgi:hypothetical protein
MIPFEELSAALRAWRLRRQGGASAQPAVERAATPPAPPPPRPYDDSLAPPLPPVIEPLRSAAGPEATGEIDLDEVVE